MKRPHGIALDEKRGLLYISDVDGKRVAVYNTDCKFVKAWATPDVYVLKTDTFENAPHGIGVDADGNIISSDFNGKCFKYDRNGNVMYSFAYYGKYH